MKIEAVIFDNDGLMVDSEPVWDRARKNMAEAVGIMDWNKDDHKAVMGVSTLEWAEYMIKRLKLDKPPQAVIDELVELMLALYREEVPFMVGAVAAVEYASSHYPTAVASGSHPDLLDAVMNDPAVKGKFKVIVSADTVPNGKPSPDVYLETAKQLGVNPENCVCLEDSGNGILAGKNAGMTVIAVPDDRFPPNQEKLAKADYVLNSLEEFPALLDKLGADV